MSQVTERRGSKRSDVGPSKKSCPSNSMPELTLQEHLLTVDSLMQENEELDRRIRKIINDSAEKLSDVDSFVQESAGTSFDEHSYASCVINNSLIAKQQLKTGAGMESLKAPFSALQQEVQGTQQDMAKLEDHLEDECNSMEYNAINQQTLAEEPTKPPQIVLNLYKEAVNMEVAGIFRNIMEAELICSICTEYFIKATTIECGHSFCADCLETWKKTKKECPICRNPFSTTINSLVIDSCIDKVFEQLGPEEQEKRKSVVDERMKSIKRKKRKPSGRRRGRRRSRVAAMRRELPTVQSLPAAPSLRVSLMQHPYFQVFF